MAGAPPKNVNITILLFIGCWAYTVDEVTTCLTLEAWAAGFEHRRRTTIWTLSTLQDSIFVGVQTHHIACLPLSTPEVTILPSDTHLDKVLQKLWTEHASKQDTSIPGERSIALLGQSSRLLSYASDDGPSNWRGE